MLTLVYVAIGALVFAWLATAIVAWRALGKAHQWELAARHWKSLALRVPRQPALTTVLPFRAPWAHGHQPRGEPSYPSGSEGEPF